MANNQYPNQWQNHYRIIKASNGHPTMTLRDFYANNDIDAKQTLLKEQTMPAHMFTLLWLERFTEQEGITVKVEV